MSLDLTYVVPIYQESMDSMIDQMGKDHLLVYKDTIVILDPEFADDIRPGEIRKPSYKSENGGEAPVITTNTEQIRGLIQFNPSDYQHFETNVDKSTGIMRLKTFLTDVPKILKCEYIIPNFASKEYCYMKYKLVREPVPRGLQVDRYAVSYWERI